MKRPSLFVIFLVKTTKHQHIINIKSKNISIQNHKNVVLKRVKYLKLLTFGQEKIFNIYIDM